MRDAGLVKDRSNTVEVHALVEPADGDLRVQVNFSRFYSSRSRNRARQQLCAHSPAPMVFQHGHATDLGSATVQYNSGRANRAWAINGKKMNCPEIVVIELDCARHALLLDEHSKTDRVCLRKFRRVGNSLYGYSGQFL